MTVHQLKTVPCYFQAVLDRDKTFEIRNTRDRCFQKGDTLVLEEWDPNRWNRRTGRSITALVTYVCTYEQKPDMVVMGLSIVEEKTND